MASADPYKAFAAAVRKTSGKSTASAIVPLLGKLVSVRLKRRVVTPTASQTTWPATPRATPAVTRRRSARRIGRAKAYTPTTRPDTSRLGTFRHYMIALIRRHTNTRDAEREHAECDNPKYSKNRLDFNWAADNGFINWN